MAYYPYQPYYQQAQQPASLIWVNSIAEAQTYPVAPNNAVALWDSKTLFIKQADASGRPSMKVYDLVERVEAPPDEPRYATKDDISAIRAAIEAVRDDIETIRDDMRKGV